VLRFYVHKAKLIQHQSSNQEITTMLLLSIILGTLLAGVGSVLLAALFRPGGTSRFAPDMLGFAAGALLSTACLHLLPEAFEGGIEARRIGIALLGGLVLFFVLDKAELWHHGHEHHAGQAAHPADAGHAHPAPARSGVWAVLVGDSVHCFGDGLLIAAAFMADLQLGALASLAVLTHEVPHHFGDLVVLGQSSRARQRATSKVALAGAVTVIGGLVGYALLEPLKPLLPYFLAAAASSFVYVALADLIPQLQKPVGLRQSVRHIAWLLLGIAVVALATSFDVD
jgi:zinc and cadmium transporter